MLVQGWRRVRSPGSAQRIVGIAETLLYMELLVSEIICRGAGFSYVLTRDTKGMNGLGHQRNEFLTAKSCSGRRYKFAGSTVMTTL